MSHYIYLYLFIQALYISKLMYVYTLHRRSKTDTRVSSRPVYVLVMFMMAQRRVEVLATMQMFMVMVLLIF